MKVIKKGLYGLNVLLVVFTLISCVAAHVNPNTFSIASILALSFPVMCALNILVILYWLIIEPKNSFLSFVGLLLVCNSFLNFFNWGLESQSGDTQTVRVMSYNLGGNYFLDKKTQKRRNKWLPKDIVTRQIDIIAFQESASRKKWENELLDYDKFHFSSSGTSIYSKYAIQNKGKIDFNNKTNSVVWIDVDIRGKMYRVYSVHLKSNQISSSDLEAINDLDRDYEKNIEETKGVLKKYLKESKIRSQQVDQVLMEIAKSPHPVIVCGDFNEPPYSYVYKQMIKEHKDSFRQKGKGFEPTFAGSIPFLRIDYVFLDSEIEVLKHEVVDQEWSDHFPLIVDLKLP